MANDMPHRYGAYINAPYMWATHIYIYTYIYGRKHASHTHIHIYIYMAPYMGHVYVPHLFVPDTWRYQTPLSFLLRPPLRIAHSFQILWS